MLILFKHIEVEYWKVCPSIHIYQCGVKRTARTTLYSWNVSVAAWKSSHVWIGHGCKAPVSFPSCYLTWIFLVQLHQKQTGTVALNQRVWKWNKESVEFFNACKFLFDAEFGCVSLKMEAILKRCSFKVKVKILLIAVFVWILVCNPFNSENI
jgi:hypothetical protein